MEIYEELLKAKSLDELLQESKGLNEKKNLDIIASDNYKPSTLPSALESQIVKKRIEESVIYSGTEVALQVMGRKIVYGAGSAVKGTVRGAIGAPKLSYGLLRGAFEGGFFVPYALRKIGGIVNNNELGSYHVGYMISFMTSVIATPLSFCELILEHNLFTGLSLLGTQVATNALSGLYEWYRYEKNKLKQIEIGDKKDGK